MALAFKERLEVDLTLDPTVDLSITGFASPEIDQLIEGQKQVSDPDPDDLIPDGDHATPWDPHQPPAPGILLGQGGNIPRDGGHALIEVPPVRREILEQVDHTRREHVRALPDLRLRTR